MKLNKEQIAQVRDFINSRGITHHDLQLEIIDHVACRVEVLMTADDSLTVDEAIAQTHSEFGPLGFSAFEDAMRTSLQRKYWRLFRRAFAEYLSWKYLPLIAGFVILFYQVSVIINQPHMVVDVVRVVMLLVLVITLVATFRWRRAKKQMLYAQLNSTAVIVLNIPIQLYNVLNIFIGKKEVINAGTTGVILSLLIVITVIGLLALKTVAKTIRQQAEELEEQYLQTVG